MTEQKKKGYQGIRATEAFECENISDKVIPAIDVFTDEPVVQCDVQVVENTFIDDSK